MPDEPEPLLTEKELCDALKIPSIWTVRRLRKKKKIPFVQIGYRTIRFRVSEVSRALRKLEVKEAGFER